MTPEEMQARIRLLEATVEDLLDVREKREKSTSDALREMKINIRKIHDAAKELKEEVKFYQAAVRRLQEDLDNSLFEPPEEPQQ